MSSDRPKTTKGLQLADAYYELYSLRELKELSAVLNELGPLVAEVGYPEVMRALHIAMQWKSTDGNKGQSVH